MPTECSNPKAIGISTMGAMPFGGFGKAQRLYRVLAALFLWGTCFSALGWPQDQNAPEAGSGKGKPRTSLKPVLPEFQAKKAVKSKGITAVDLETGLDSLLRGGEPKNREELISLQKQQAKVAEKVNLVTVNLQHGTTQGSGVIISPEGFVLTAAHVAGRPKQKINIILHDGTRIEGVTMGVNRDMDAGLVRIVKPERDPEKDPWPHASLGSTAKMQLGQWCIASGHPGGWLPDRPAVVRVGRLLRILPSTLITDCSLIGGDSGGPLFDLQGKLIGIHSRIGIDVEDNMHVPIDVFDDSWDRLVRNEAWGALPGFKPAIGVVGATDRESDNVCKIARVDPSGPAAKAGIKAGDIITRFDSVAIQNFDQLKETVDSLTPGEQVSVELLRDEKKISVRLIVGMRE